MTKLFAVVLMVLASGFSLARTANQEPIRTFMPDSFKQMQASHAGKPLIVMVWSLDCSYCEESFAALAQAQRRHGFEVVTITTDRVDSETTRDLIINKVAASGLRSEVWAFGSAPAEQLRYAIDPKWRGEMPRTYWFKANGQVVAYSGVVTNKIVEKLL